MNVARKWVFPILRLIFVAAIAVALVKVAFYPDSAPERNPAEPTGVVVEPEIPVAIGTVKNDVTLPGTVSADPAVAVKSTAVGTVDEIFVTAGQAVNSGDKIYDIRVETIKDPVESTDADGNITITQPKPVVTFAKVLAPISGVLSALGVIHGQSVAVGDSTGQVAPPSFSVSGALSPEQQYRLLTKPTEATVTITNGPAPFTCTSLTITSPLAGAGTVGDGGSADPGTSGTTVTCAIPAEVTVFSGLAAQITIAAGLAENVLVVPTTAVKGSAETGVVWFVLPGGGTEERPVTLGMTDGINVQVIDGLVEGDLINQFVPGASAVPPGSGGCDLQPDGSEVCFGPSVSSSGISQ
ncbi:efflux RND transporter periplasmic adaptor subunit [Cryobacterium sp. PH29-G1]|uniref:efflux RND transporter periplasmic adaptor subunit n=1 Tax=Cryobacterium sp. PH29-G1 TaxID=3046211 RepID=UPI0024B96442|nr:efflux RND transporter periplasmic adaptor subunit [Cryobacterium sp. PH29-G1]MDJ0349328.1 efflux RND transporter periplasmic adaptor subunit [Cryobacterium sp. PH29-G1]